MFYRQDFTNTVSNDLRKNMFVFKIFYINIPRKMKVI